MSSNTSMFACPVCKNPNTSYMGSGLRGCPECGCIFDAPTIFHWITASPEVLAPKLVYQGFDGGFYSSVIEDGTKEFRNEPEAIAATVAKLKEVKNG